MGLNFDKTYTPEKRRKTNMNPNWIKFFLADFLIAGGADCAHYNILFLGVFCFVGGVGLAINMLYDITKDW